MNERDFWAALGDEGRKWLAEEPMRARRKRVRKELREEGVEARCAQAPFKYRGVSYIRASPEVARAAVKKCVAENVKRRMYCEIAAEVLLANLVRDIDMPAQRAKADAQAAYARHSSDISLARFRRAAKLAQVAGERTQMLYGRVMAGCRSARPINAGLRGLK